MEKVQLSGKLSFSRIVQGFWRLTEWNMPTEELVRLMHGCIERGVTSMDTAEIYGGGECERLLGLAFKQDSSLRDQIQLVSKTGIFRHEGAGYYNTGYKRVVQSCKESLQRLQCDYLDLYLIHREDPCFDPWETAQALQDLKKEGLILEVGVSNFDPFKFDALNTAMGGTLVTNQIEWNPLCFEHFSSGMMDVLAKLKCPPMLWSPLAGGRVFTGQDEAAQNLRQVLAPMAQAHNVSEATLIFAWLLYHPVRALPISGSRSLARLDDAIAALDVQLEHWEWYRLYTASGQMHLR